MRKKILLLTSILCIFSCLLFALPAKTEATNNSFRVGYARVDINPYVVDGDPTSGIMALPLAGTGDVWNRLSQNTLMDDNGDGVVDENDGLKATCIAEILMGRRSVADWRERSEHYIRCIDKAEQSAAQVRRLFVEEEA